MNKQFVMLLGIILMLNVGMVFAADIGVIGDEKPVDVTAVKADICYNNKYEFKNCDSKAVDEVKIKEEEKLLIKTDAVYLIGIDKKEKKLEDKKGSSIYIHKKVGTTYHVDNLNDIPVETYLDFYYTKQPNVITHINKYGEKVKDFQVWEYQWTPKTCEGSGEDMVCSKDGYARIFTTLTENSVGSETFPLTFSPAQWKTDNQGYASFDGVDDYVETNLSYLQNTTETFCSWVISSNITNGNIYSYSSGSNIKTNLAFNSIGQLQLELVSNVSNSGRIKTNGLLANTWYHVCFTKMEGVMSSAINISMGDIYVNGINLSKSFASTGISAPSSYTSKLGYSPSTNFFNGSLDNVQIFNKSLNSTEISTLYNYGRQTKGICNLITDGQVACYDFDDNSFGDGSGNGNYGTPMGFSDTTPEVNDVTTLNSGDYSLTPSGALTIDDEKYLYRYLNAEWEYDRVRVSWLTFLLPLLAVALAFIAFKLAIEDNK